MWSEKRDSGVLETCVSPFVGKNKPKTMHNVVFCDQSDVLTGLRSLTIESVLCQKISLINHTSQQKVFRIRKTKFCDPSWWLSEPDHVCAFLCIYTWVACYGMARVHLRVWPTHAFYTTNTLYPAHIPGHVPKKKVSGLKTHQTRCAFFLGSWVGVTYA